MTDQTTEIDQISWRSIASLLVRAFFCSLLCMLGLFLGPAAALSALFAGNSGGILFHTGSGNYFGVLLLAALSILLLGASLFLFKIHPDDKEKRLLAVLPGLYILGGDSLLILFIFYSNTTTSYWGAIAGWLAPAVYLLVGQKVKAWQDWVGLLGALLIGIGLSGLEFYKTLDLSGFLVSPTWLSMAFFPELLRFRTGWKGAMVGFVLWVVLGLLSFWVFHKIPFSMFG